MTVIEKKNKLRKIIESLSKEHLDEALYFVQELTTKDKKRIAILKNLLNKEKSLFEKLAQ